MDTDLQEQQSPAAQTDQPASALQRKAKAGGVEHRSRALTLAKALRLSLARVAQSEMHLAVAVLSARIEQVPLEDLDEVLSDGHLMMMLDGPGSLRGAALFDPALVGAIIQMQTMADVHPVTDGAERAMTATDAAICAPFLNGVLRMAGPMVEVVEEQPVLQGYAFGAHCPNSRLLKIALQAHEYHLVQVTVDIAGGKRQGQITFCTPAGMAEPDEPELDHDPEGGGDLRTLEESVLALNADLRIGLTRIRLSVKALQAFKAGELLDLGAPAFDAVEVLTCTGGKVAQGHLGQVDGQRAVQLASRPKPMIHPQRRAGDVAQAELTPHQPAKADEGFEKMQAAGAQPLEMADVLGDLDEGEELAATGVAALDDLADELPDLPDMSDLPSFDDIPDLPDLPDLSEDED